jgi:hypothetical protein
MKLSNVGFPRPRKPLKGFQAYGFLLVYNFYTTDYTRKNVIVRDSEYRIHVNGNYHLKNKNSEKNEVSSFFKQILISVSYY